MKHFAGAFLVLATACGATDSPREGTSKETRQPRGAVNYRVAIAFQACPDPSDFRAQVDAILAASPKEDLPARCRLLPEGTKITLAEPGRRPTVVYRQFEFEKGTLANGETVWSNEFSSPLIMEDPPSGPL